VDREEVMKRAVGAIVVLGLAVVGCGGGDAELSGYVREPMPVVADASLPEPGAGGASFAMQAPEGHLLLVYFGFTACPDVCPTTLADVRTALGELGEDADRIEVAMATVDPGRDTDEIITGYVQSFVPGAHGLRTEDDAALRSVTEAFGAYYDVSTADDGTVEVLHTGHLYAVDDRGRLRLTWPFGTEASALAADLETLLKAG
jgi:protein SCO1/2